MTNKHTYIHTSYIHHTYVFIGMYLKFFSCSIFTTKLSFLLGVY